MDLWFPLLPDVPPADSPNSCSSPAEYDIVSTTTHILHTALVLRANTPYQQHHHHAHHAAPCPRDRSAEIRSPSPAPQWRNSSSSSASTAFVVCLKRQQVYCSPQELKRRAPRP
ncbi:uncharacterized protein MYCGRDRAFT_94775 [Zymoseptoria tritici IPO323]|uniref:Uncharacterized protein n=1 Tax=Zymoseptoria tritici (strain CBS 115943 / IPO323) TaxID=336722 RepID=F9XF47_ZYMTI|nr:uncharacterized protein MYCGRDRAFT_94775 [Zymoseptoria tritici IPO323]EGP85860.1 hypothetical protein MYCGRDRAFT_94775 [Zymoseptoria tritici IPO323]